MATTEKKGLLVIHRESPEGIASPQAFQIDLTEGKNRPTSIRIFLLRTLFDAFGVRFADLPIMEDSTGLLTAQAGSDLDFSKFVTAMGIAIELIDENGDTIAEHIIRRDLPKEDETK